jgi:membrane fusion protein, multidrug efflux system
MAGPGWLEHSKKPTEEISMEWHRRTNELPIAILAGTLLSMLLLQAACKDSEKKAPPPPEVLVADVVQKDVPIVREWVGTLIGDVNAEIRPKVEGYILRQIYTEGSFVNKGQPLFQIDPRQFQAALDQAKGELERQKAALEKATNDVNRYTPLVAQRAISQQELDNALSSQRAAQANVAAATAAAENAKLNLDWSTVTSPIAGIAGIAQFQVGALVNGQSVLTTVSTVNPIQVLFQISEQEYLRGAEAAKQGFKIDTLSLELILADGSVYPHKGLYTVSDREVNVKTGTIAVKGTFPNPGNILRPGQFAKVRTAVYTAKNALLVPQKALADMQGNPMVAVVKPDNTVDMRSVKPGPVTGGMLVIEEGLKAGEKVVVEGLQKVQPNKPVVAKAAPAEGAAPAAAAEKKPETQAEEPKKPESGR